MPAKYPTPRPFLWPSIVKTFIITVNIRIKNKKLTLKICILYTIVGINSLLISNFFEVESF